MRGVHVTYSKGLSYVISTLPAAPAAAAIKRLVEPMVTGLQRNGVIAGDAKLAQQELDRLTVVVTYANPAMPQVLFFFFFATLHDFNNGYCRVGILPPNRSDVAEASTARRSFFTLGKKAFSWGVTSHEGTKYSKHI